MSRYGAQFGQDVTFLGVERCSLDDPASFAGADVVTLGAPFDGGTYPPYDHADITTAPPNRVVLEALSAIARRRRDATDGTRWDPSLPLLADRPSSRDVPQ